MANPLVSIVIPIYNIERHIGECLASVARQTFDDFEVICVNDGSTDNSRYVVLEYARHDDRFVLLDKPNGGLSDARNFGIERACGKYVFLLDGDDWIEDRALEIMICEALANDLSITVCDYEFFLDETGEEIDSVTLGDSLFAQGRDACHWEYKYPSVTQTMIYAWGKLYKKELFDEIHYPVGLLVEDAFTTWKLIYKADHVGYIPRRFVHYRMRADSIMGAGYSDEHLVELDALAEKLSFFTDADDGYMVEGIEDRIFHRSMQLDAAAGGSGRKIIREKLSNIISTGSMESMQRSPNYRSAMLMQARPVLYAISARPLKALKEKTKGRLPKLARKLKALKKRTLIRTRLKDRKALFASRDDISAADYILVDSPTHGNLGDHAIVISELQMLDDCLPDDLRRCELADYCTDRRERRAANMFKKGTTIILRGGGFLGSLWPHEEKRFRRLLRAFSDKRIIVMPQTVYFDTSTEEGRAFLAESRRSYASHPDLTICLRERMSFEFMQQNFPTVKTILAPDMVLNMRYARKSDCERSGAAICLRSDKERSIADADELAIYRAVRARLDEGVRLRWIDTVTPETVEIDERERALEEKLDTIAGCKLVVTDRLHGMVFSAITGTPCVALGNCNGKVQAVYEWIDKLPYIVFAGNVSEAIAAIGDIDLEKRYEYDASMLDAEFADLRNLLADSVKPS